MPVNDLNFSREDTNTAKGIAIILMMLHHLFRFPDRIEYPAHYLPLIPGLTPSPEFIIADFGKLCVAMFLFLSGYGLYAVYERKGNFTFKDSLRRLIKFMISYWTIFALFVPIGLMFFSSDPRYHFDLMRFTQNFFVISSSYNEEWWFARTYLALLLSFPLIKYLLRNTKIALGSSLMLYVLSFLFLKYHNSPFLSFVQQLFLWQASFMTGALVKKYNVFTIASIKLSEFRYSKLVSLVMIATLFISREFLQFIVHHYIGKGDAFYFDFLLAPVFIFFSVNLLSNIKIISIFGKHSNNIWLMHTFFAFYFFQNIIFFPSLSLLVFIWLSFLCIFTSIIITFITNTIKSSLPSKDAQTPCQTPVPIDATVKH